MSFSQRLAQAAGLVEAELARIMDAVSAGGAPPRLVAGLRHAALGGGKRLRPFLVLESAGVFGVAAMAALPAAVGIELMHCYSLVHDDLPAMDDDDLRRGRPTVHKAFDEWTAILVGDALHALAFRVLADARVHSDAHVHVELVRALAEASGPVGMVGGQYLDLEADKLGLPAAPTHTHVARLQAMKTGALIRCACEAGAIVARAEDAGRQALADYGAHLGAAFQIADDLLDLEGEAGEMGKAARKDGRKATLVSVLGAEAARSELARSQREACAALARFGVEADGLRAAVDFVGERRA